MYTMHVLQQARAVLALAAGSFFALLVIYTAHGEQPKTAIQLQNGNDLRATTAEELSQYASAYARVRSFNVLVSSARLQLVRHTYLAELPQLGLGSLYLRCGNPPLILVVLGGQFDVSNTARGGSTRADTRKMTVSQLAFGFNAGNGTVVEEQYGGPDLSWLITRNTAAPRPRTGAIDRIRSAWLTINADQPYVGCVNGTYNAPGRAAIPNT